MLGVAQVPTIRIEDLSEAQKRSFWVPPTRDMRCQPLRACASSDVVLIQINPIERATTPQTAQEIHNRVNEITFNSSLMKELRAIDFVRRLIDDGNLDPGDYNQVLIHRIEGGEQMLEFSASSKLNAEWGFLKLLRDIGRNSAARWFEQSYDQIGKESSIDVRSLFA